MKNKNSKSSTISITSLIKTFLIGVIFAVIFIIAKVFVENFLILSKINEEIFLYFSSIFWFWVVCIFYLLIIISYLFRKDVWHRVLILTKSRRIDLLITFILGIILVYFLSGFYIDFLKKTISEWNWNQILLLSLLPIIFFVAIWVRKLQLILKRRKNIKSFFISDDEVRNKNDDEFGFSEKAEIFAERVFDQGSPKSLVFGIDAPWGTGKSSFVNLCIEYWKKKHKNEMIIYIFNPLRYEDQENLLRKFIEGLIKEIKHNVFVPEIESLISKYAKLLKSTKASFSFFGIKFGPLFGSESMDDIFNRLEIALSNIDKKIVIVVDDLDRLNFSSIKEVLFVIKKAFTLPNISYVLCYDTENIKALEQKNLDTEKIIEFLEKFINIKTSLYLDNKLLFEYFTENKNNSLKKNLLADPELVSKAVEGLRNIFESNDFHRYLPLIGDARKLKRLINTIMLLEVEKTDFKNSDFDKQDIINLLLIYINYPNIFRKIYNTETQGKRGFFSLVTVFDHGYPRDKKSGVNSDSTFKNSVEYQEYLKTSKLSPQQKFILNKVFNASERQIDDSGNVIDSSKVIPREIITSYACFNGTILSSENRNLEKYLNLITKMYRPLKTKEYKYYVNAKDEILSKKLIEDVFTDKEFSFSKNEDTHEELWRVLASTDSKEFSVEKSKEIISYSLNVLPQYSLLEIESIGIGFRNTLTYFIAKLLDLVGWTDSKGKHGYNNTDENVIKISEWVFGEGGHKQEGILNILGKEERGVLGLHDLLSFRLKCCSDRGGDLFNLSRALIKHGDLEAPTSGMVRDIVVGEMREISQRVFQIFKSQYIDKDKNIFNEINKLTLENVCGKYFDYVKAKTESGDIKNIDQKLFSLQSRMKAFIIYQLGNTIISSGIGCGYYNVIGKEDNKGISQATNKYLFEHCFNPQKDESNYKYFLDFLLINFSYITEGKYIPHINEFIRVLDDKKLKDYWCKHGVEIKSKNYESEDRNIFTVNYIASYKEDLKSTFEVLDEFIKTE
jgi:hypothetical protein